MKGKQAYLFHPGPGVFFVGSVGKFGSYVDDEHGKPVTKQFPEIAVSDSIAAQMSVSEMKAEGWEVKWRKIKDDPVSAPTVELEIASVDPAPDAA